MRDRRAAVFLDRDDTLILNREITAHAATPGDLADAEMIKLIPGVALGLGALAQAGFALVVVSNQGVVARGGATLSNVEACHRRMSELIRTEDGPGLDAILACPFHPRGRSFKWTREHHWRKPSPGMLLAAADDLHLDLSRSWLIGDARRDADAAILAGIDPARAVLVDPERTAFVDVVKRITQST